MATPVRAQVPVELILDFSGSMIKARDGETQVDTLRNVLLQASEQVSPDRVLAIRAYGHRIAQEEKEKSCQDSELLIPLAPVSRDAIEKALSPLKPMGFTPIAYALSQLSTDLESVAGQDKVVILVSDGEESCAGDPIGVVQKLRAEDAQLTLHTIGFHVDAKTRQQLEALARVGGGQYLDATSADALSQALLRTLNTDQIGPAPAQAPKAPIKKKTAIKPVEIRGGTKYEEAVPVEFDKVYRLDHHLAQGAFDYFSLDVDRGQEMTLILRTLQKGLIVRDDKAYESNEPFAGLQFQGAAHNEIAKLDIQGKVNGEKEFYFLPTTSGRYYMLIGSALAPLHKDHVEFIVSRQSRGDLGAETDAGESLSQALPIIAQRYPENFLGSGDQKDVYSFSVKKGEEYFVGIIPNEDFATHFAITIYDEYKQKIMTQASGTNEGLKSETLKIEESGTYYLEISLGEAIGKPLSYTLVLKKITQPEAVPQLPIQPKKEPPKT